MAPQARAMERQAYSLDNFVPLNPTPVMLKNPDLEFFPTAEGFYDYKKDQYIYQYKDHLGNVRISFGRNSSGALQLVDVNDYYPFGMNHLKSGNSFFGAGSYKNYKFQEQELQETGFYNFKWRNYMPDVGRFFNIDPLAEKLPYNSTYAFAENRVIDGRELEGLEWVTVKNDQGKTIERKLTVSVTNDAGLNERQYNRLIESIKTDFSSVFGADGARAQLTISDNSTMKVNLSNQVSTPLTDANDSEYSTYQGGVTAIRGESQVNSFSVTAKVDGTRRETSDITRSFNHEAAHSAGLDHPWENRDHVSDVNQNSPTVQPNTIKSNLLNSGANPNDNYKLNASGTNLTPGQFNSMDRKIQSQQPRPPQNP
uniref:RHS repeat-associated core domain-containing protein n=1 Tax=Chryseobacterium endophyticum TaxID=1854762 RepID=A0AAU6WSK8_9FLAO